MAPRLVLFVEESDKKRKDAQVFIVRDNDGLFRVYSTRAFGSTQNETVPVVKLAYKSYRGVLLYLRTLLDWKSNQISVELHATSRFNVDWDFNDLWFATGTNTELAAFDGIKFKNLRRWLFVLERSLVLGASTEVKAETSPLVVDRSHGVDNGSSSDEDEYDESDE